MEHKGKQDIQYIVTDATYETVDDEALAEAEKDTVSILGLAKEYSPFKSRRRSEGRRYRRSLDFTSPNKDRITRSGSKDKYEEAEVTLDLDETEYHPWMYHFMQSLKERVPRKVYWLYDGGGQVTYKTKFASLKEECVPKRITRVVGSPLFFIESLRSASEDPRWTQEGIIFDLHKGFSSSDKLYDILNIYSDGYIITSKGIKKVDNYPLTIWVFSNELPVFEKLTYDKWCVYLVNYDKDIESVMKWVDERTNYYYVPSNI